MAMFKNVNVAPIDTSGFERAGAAYGQMFQNLGDTVANTIEKHQKKKAITGYIENAPPEVLNAMGVSDPSDPDQVKIAVNTLNKGGQPAWNMIQLGATIQQQQRQQDQFNQEQAERERMGQAQRDLINTQVQRGMQDIDQSAKSFGDEQANLQATTEQIQQAIRSNQLSDKQSIALHPGVIAQRQATLEATQAGIGLTEARTEQTRNDILVAQSAMVLSENKDERDTAAQNYHQDITTQRLDLDKRIAAIGEKNSKEKIELESQRINLLANQFAFDQMYKFREQDLGERKFEAGNQQFQKEFQLKKKQFNDGIKLRKKEIGIARGKLQQAIKSNASTIELNNAKKGYYDSLATAGPTVSSSEFERTTQASVRSGMLTQEEADSLTLQRAMNLSGINQGMPIDKQLSIMGGMPAGGVDIETLDLLEARSREGGKFNDKPIKVTVRKRKGQEDVEVIEVYNSKGQKAEIIMSPANKAKLNQYRKLASGFMNDPGGGSFNPGNPSNPDVESSGAGGFNWEQDIDQAF